MLSHYLKSSISDIENLIDLTQKDILDIKEAKHEAIFNRTKIKDELIQSFVNKKSLLDNELVKFVQINDNKPLEDILNEEHKEMLNTMKEKLSCLKIKNREYARFVVSVSEFYNSMLDRVFPREMEGYHRANHKPASFIKLRA